MPDPSISLCPSYLVPTATIKTNGYDFSSSLFLNSFTLLPNVLQASETVDLENEISHNAYLTLVTFLVATPLTTISAIASISDCLLRL